MEFIDLKQQHRIISKEITNAFDRVMAHGRYINGPEVGECEQALSAYVGVKHTVGVSSGTDALLVALMALGVGPGDEVITTSFSFYASVEVILFLGAVPVMLDVDKDTCNIDINLIEAAITDKTKAIMPVGLFGQMSDLEAINAIANKHNLPVLEDAAQSFGATQQGKRSGSLTTIACTSFFPAKPLGCYGDGGACFTNDDTLAEQMRIIAHHGESTRYHHTCLGINGRFDTVQAAFLIEKLKLFPDELEKRQQVAACYHQHLDKSIQRQAVLPGNQSSWAQFTIMVDDRDGLREVLAAADIPTAVHYPVPMHQQPVIANYAHRAENISVAVNLSKRVLSLPFHPYMSEQDVKIVATIINEANITA